MRILDQEIRIKENLLYSLQRYPVWWMILITTMFFDFLSTTVFVAEYGTRAEANITTRLMMENINPYLGNLMGKLLQLISVVCLVGLTRRVGNFFLLFVILLNCWAVVMNSILV
jgi:hypothetical protein